MNLWIENVKLIAPGHALNQQLVDILIEEGIIIEISKKIQRAPKGFIKKSFVGCCISIGWFDIGTHVGEPGFEFREDLSSVNMCAQSGGFTELACMPNTFPVIQNKSDIQFLRHSTTNCLVKFHPIGAISNNTAGKTITHFMEMAAHGAVGFSDGQQPINNVHLLQTAMQYSLNAKRVILNSPCEQQLMQKGAMHEGVTSIRMGGIGIPYTTESIMLQRDLEVQKYTEASLISHLISARQSVNIIENHIKSIKNHWSTVCYLNLIHTDADLVNYNTSLKVLPPLRASNDRKALIKAVKKGTIPIICSNHTPIDMEHKNLEFSRSEFGAIGLQTCYAAIQTFVPEIDTETWINAIAYHPRMALNLPIPNFDVGSVANFCIFDQHKSWTFDQTNNQSKSQNSPFIGTQFKGKVIAIGRANHFHLFE